MPRLSILAFALALVSAPFADADTADPYYNLIYDYEVASFCGLVRTPVHEKYARKRADLERASGLDADTLTDIRVGAMADAEREYINRGLGGHKPWCRSDGRAGVRRILGE
ncbi:MAG: hypothetical protein JJ855_14145 [Rhodospirillales bacterium]|nr:hypothetical protein [Rhodospirillales bacterium]